MMVKEMVTNQLENSSVVHWICVLPVESISCKSNKTNRNEEPIDVGRQ